MTDSKPTNGFIYMDGRIVPHEEATLHVASSAVLYGLSVYTVFPIIIVDSKLLAFRLEDHYRRLVESAQIMGIDSFPGEWSYDHFIEAAKMLAKKNSIKADTFVRATVHVNAIAPGTRSRGLPVTLSMFMYPATYVLPQSGARLKSSVWRRIPDSSIPARAKVNGSYVNSVLAKQDALDSGYDDCIFLDSAGHVCELSVANIFLVKDGCIITPDTNSDLLDGINRRTIIALAGNENITVVERPVDLTELYIADEVFATGTSAGVTPVVNVDSRTINGGKVGEITQRLAALHQAALQGKLSEFEHFVHVL